MIELSAAVEETWRFLVLVKDGIRTKKGLTALSQMYNFNPLPPQNCVYDRLDKEQNSANNSRYH